MHIFNIHRTAAALLLALVFGSASAQAPAAKPAEGKTLSLGSSSSGGGGKLLTRDELRACMKQREALTSRLADLERQNAPLEVERDSITKGRAALTAGREDIRVKDEALKGLATRLADFNLKTKDLQARVEEFNAANRSGMTADRQRADLQREQAALLKEQPALEADRLAIIKASEEAVSRFNAQAKQIEDATVDWNQRNGKLQEQLLSAADDRQAWVTGCGNRRYLEADEIAIRSGK